MSGPGESVRVQLRCCPAALREAREAADRFDQLPPAALDALKLTVSELVANSVRHSGLDEHDLIDVAIQTQRDHVRVDVRDGGHGFKSMTTGRQGGLGLVMVQGLARRSGIDRGATTHAWAEIALGNLEATQEDPADFALPEGWEYPPGYTAAARAWASHATPRVWSFS